MIRVKRLFAALAAAALAVAIAGPSARGGTVTLSGNVVTFQAADGEVNDVSVSVSSDYFEELDPNIVVVTVRDYATALVAGAGCTQRTANWTTCPLPPHVSTYDLRVALGDMDDRGSIAGAAGDDDDEWGGAVEPHPILDGGEGNDILRGLVTEFENQEALRGGAGDDRLLGDTSDPTVVDVLDGGPGADVLAGGSGVDTVVYEDRLDPVVVTLNGLRDDGERAERDLVRSDVERIVGGRGADLLVGNRRANVLLGGDAGDRLRGGGGNDVLRGAAGRDALVGGPGQDTLRGGEGRDAFYARDGGRDRLFGGSGRDRARVDRGLDRRRLIERLF